MSFNRVRKIIRNVSGIAPALSLALFILPSIAETRADSIPYYDATKEVTLSGTVSGVLTTAPRGMPWGFHLLVATITGTIDASLGRWGLRGNEALSRINGKQVDFLGVMKRIDGKQVLLVRSVKVDGKIYVIRNARGVPLSPQARERAVRKGEPL